MGVIDSQWWSLWWPWAAVWLGTALCLGVLLRHAVARWWPLPGHRGEPPVISGMCIYVNETWVKDIADMHGIPNTGEMAVAAKVATVRGLGMFARFGTAGGKAQHDETKERVVEYLEQNTPMKALSLTMEKLRARDWVVDADLATGRLVPNGTLARTLAAAADRSTASLTAVRSDFVLVTGLFTAHRADGGGIVLRARYGPDEPPAHVRITCKENWVREEFRVEDYAEGEFPATCLGRVRVWNGTTAELTLDPVSVFH
ncbi:hypothetical protein [Streptomyces sp. YU58]|uniref:hypothetical protein n=1 Tax=Streptomyces sp. SX92 TaxID=3158972 RepID=UPI0027B8E858|nr:hypothetical protein [Streptomyces coralus]WLW55493.1 hypothetical protein QU709_30975 [Streptomyces coralus]